jgi:hypothetical protein
MRGGPGDHGERSVARIGKGVTMSESAEHQATAPLTPDERTELDRLRAEITALRAEHPPRTRSWKSVVAAVLLVLGCVFAPISLATVWVHNQVADTDRFTATMSPLIHEPSVQAAVTDRVTETVFGYVDVKALADDAVRALADTGLPPVVIVPLQGLTGPLASSVQSFVHGKMAELVASPGVAELWDRAIRVAHEQLNAALSGNSSALVVSGGEVRLDLAPFISAAKQQLVAAGFTVANRIPDVHPTIAVADATTLVRGRTAYTALDRLATWLPWVTLVLLAAGVYLARRHRRAVLTAALGVAAGMLVLAILVLIARAVLIGAVPPRSAEPTGATYDLVVRFLRAGGRTVLAVALVVAFGAFLTGPSVTATAIRRGLTKGMAWLREGGARAGLRTGPVGGWVHAHGTALRIAAAALAVLVLAFLDRPSGLTVLLIAVLLVVGLGVIQFLDQPPPTARGRDEVAPPSPGSG